MPAAVEPGDGSLDHPTSGWAGEALGRIRAFDNFNFDFSQDTPQGLAKLRTLITAIGIELSQEWMLFEQGRHQ